MPYFYRHERVPYAFGRMAPTNGFIIYVTWPDNTSVPIAHVTNEAAAVAMVSAMNNSVIGETYANPPHLKARSHVRTSP